MYLPVAKHICITGVAGQHVLFRGKFAELHNFGVAPQCAAPSTCKVKHGGELCTWTPLSNPKTVVIGQ